MKQKVIAHLRKAGFNEERIEIIINSISIEEAYINLKRNKILQKVIDNLGIEEVERCAKKMKVTIDIFAKEYDRWNNGCISKTIRREGII